MTLEEVKEFLQSEEGKKEEVIAYLQEINPLTVARVQEFLEVNPEAKSWMDSIKDKHLSKGLETWKSNNLENLISEEIKTRFPEKDEKEVEVEKLRSEIEQMKQEKLRESLTNKAIKIATEKNLPVELVDFFIGKDEEMTASNLQALENTFSQSVQKMVETRLKGEGYVPPKDSEVKSGNLEGLSMEEYIKERNK
ncbi:DUF4355 domain-containing protein [Natronincola ferrireducens]|uniref:DUF4355 domain-containing protein n=1 Tax=Natronincola ferrireducens TaxID=393762 RepID=A0A1G9IHR3_9FIRM|nr:DUF4355 domain-containing protein [Natronincola ferrireducens]SDL24463.1 protein of unknown function [Natronincola ferrireducens]